MRSHYTEPYECLRPTEYINSEHPSIQDVIQSLDLDDLSASDRAQSVFRYVRDEIQFEFLPKDDPTKYIASNILEEGRGFCVQKAILLCALGRAARVPTALVLSDLRDESLSPRVVELIGGNVLHNHGLVAFFLNGSWVKADPTFSPDVVARKGYWPVEFDGQRDALLAPRSLSGEPHATYLRFKKMLDEAPVESIIAEIKAHTPGGDLRVFHDCVEGLTVAG